MSHPNRSYWDTGVKNLPQTTGTANRLDAEDLRQVCTELGIPLPLTGGVLDVGCGSARLAQLVKGPYLGLDITRSAVEYGRARGVSVFQIQGAEDVSAPMYVEWITCVSVFTHMGLDEQAAYLERFDLIAAKNLLIDIVPGDGGGVELFRQSSPAFVESLSKHGFTVKASTFLDWDGVIHQFFWAGWPS